MLEGDHFLALWTKEERKVGLKEEKHVATVQREGQVAAECRQTPLTKATPFPILPEVLGALLVP